MISIAMATYNGERFLREQLDSIIAQTITDWELHVCDDCSTDSTFAILEEYANRDSRIHVHLNEHNLGFKKNFEKAISFCTGDYIAFSDQDDVWCENKLELELTEIKDFDLVCTNAMIIDDVGRKTGENTFKIRGYETLVNDNKKLFIHLFFANFVQGATILAKTSFVKKCMPVPEEFVFHDWYLAIMAATKTGIVCLNDSLIYYREHQKSLTNKRKKGFWSRLVSFICRGLKRSHSLQSKANIAQWCEKNVDLFPSFRSDIVDINQVYEHPLRLKTLLYLLRNYDSIFIQSEHKLFNLLKLYFALCIPEKE